METLKTLLESHIAGFTLAKLLSARVLTAVCLIIVKLLMRTLNRFFERIQVPAMLMGMVRAITKVLLLFLVVLIVMGYLDIPVTSLVAAMSVVGLAVSLSVQNFLSNVTGKAVTSGAEIKKNAILHLTNPVLWTDEEAVLGKIIQEGQAAGEEWSILEPGPGKVLCGLWKDTEFSALVSAQPVNTADHIANL